MCTKIRTIIQQEVCHLFLYSIHASNNKQQRHKLLLPDLFVLINDVHYLTLEVIFPQSPQHHPEKCRRGK